MTIGLATQVPLEWACAPAESLPQQEDQTNVKAQSDFQGQTQLQDDPPGTGS